MLGVLSLVFWSLILVVTREVRAAASCAPTTAARAACWRSARWRRGPEPRAAPCARLIVGLSIAGLALFYGDGADHPRDLGALGGRGAGDRHARPRALRRAARRRGADGLFLIQSRGTAMVGQLFGPVMLAWFAVLGVLGLYQIVQHPGVLAALNPLYAFGLFKVAGTQAFVALGAIVLAVTGAEALYADMGHFGRLPIRIAWFAVVLPGLVLNYFGQGALVLHEPPALEQPVLPPGAGLGAAPAGRARHAGHHHRLAGGDLGRVLAHPAGDPARLPAAHDDPPHLGGRDRADLHPADQLAADGRRPRRWCSASAPPATSPRPTASRSPAP